MDKIYRIGKDNKKYNDTLEVPFITNTNKYKIDIYSFIGDYESYIFRYRKDDRFICEFDMQLNFIRPIETPVSKKDFDIAFDRLSEYSKRTAWIDDYFSDC